MSIRASLVLVALVAPVALVACGRRATRDDCDVLVDRNVEVMLKSQGTTDPAIIAKRKDEMRAEVRDRIDQCVGKRVTDHEIACVKAAETADQIDKCLR